jgi:hypothetical protein
MWMSVILQLTGKYYVIVKVIFNVLQRYFYIVGGGQVILSHN